MKIEGELEYVRTAPVHTHDAARVQVRYTYMDSDRTHISEELGYGRTKWTFFSRSGAAKFAEQIESQDPLMVYVDPNDPSRAVLFPERQGIINVVTVGWTIGWVVFGGLGTAMVVRNGVAMARGRRRTR